MNLREYMFYAGMTQKEMAEKLDISPNYIRLITCGAFPVSKKFAKNVEKVTNGLVKASDITGPNTHPDANKILM